LTGPWPRLPCCQADNASLWGGFVDGAIESGLREARRVAAALAQAG
jgi:monoamine oxidase